jgi:diguanylate cyclase (GGDEF)-like protein
MATPSKQRTARKSATPRAPRRAAPPTPPRVLIVDDSKVARTAIRTVLEGEFEVIEAEDGEQGWQALATNDSIRAVVTDANMPNLDGYGLISRIRGSPEVWIQNIPVVMVTGVEEKAARARALEAGVTDFFHKPVYKTVFLDKIRTHVRLGQATRKLIETSAALAEEGAIDPVTGINSRRYFLERVAQDLAYSKRHAQNLSIIFIEADGFEELARAGDDTITERLLIWLAHQLKETVRTEDTIARINDSRFAVTMVNSGRLEAAVLGDRLRKLITATDFIHGDVPRRITVSLCLVSVGRDPIESVDDFLVIADRRLAQARGEGGNRMISSDSPETQMDESMTELLSSLDALLQDVERNGDKLAPYLTELVERAVRILEVGNDNLGLDILDGIRYIKAKLHPLKRITGRG